MLDDDLWYGTLIRSPSRRKGSRRRSRSPWRGPPPNALEKPELRSRSISPEYHTTCLDQPSRTPSPHETPTPQEYYGTTQLEQRSRSPSPSSVYSVPSEQIRPNVASRPGGRRLPPIPNKPSMLHLNSQSNEGINFPTLSHSPTIPPDRIPENINFPRVNASPTRKNVNEWKNLPAEMDHTQNPSGADPQALLSTLPTHHIQPPNRNMAKINSSCSLKGVRELPQPPSDHSCPTPFTSASREAELPPSYDSIASISHGSRLPSSPIISNGYKSGKLICSGNDHSSAQNTHLNPESTSVTVQETDDDDDDWC